MSSTLFKGPILMLFSSFGFALMAYYTKLATYAISSTEVAFFRMGIGVLACLALFWAGRIRLVTENSKLLLVRGFFGGIAMILYFLALEKGTISNSTVLQGTYPIFAAVLSLYLLKEKLGWRLVLFLGITFVGMVVLIRPDVHHINIGDIYALASGLLGGIAITAVRQLRQRNESSWTIFFYFCAVGALVSLLLAIPFWKWPTGNEYFPLMMTSVLGLFAQVAMTSAFKYCSTVVGGILSMSTGVFSLMIGILFLHENAGLYDVLGIGLVLLGNILVVAFERRDEGRKSESIV